MYTFSLTNTVNGISCTETTDVTVLFDDQVYCGYDFPTAFSPNNDQTNDTFYLIDELGFYTVLSLRIYNRWGQMVHEGIGENHAWDGFHNGKPAPSDVYVFIFEIEDGQGAVTVEKGDLTLLR